MKISDLTVTKDMIIDFLRDHKDLVESNQLGKLFEEAYDVYEKNQKINEARDLPIILFAILKDVGITFHQALNGMTEIPQAIFSAVEPASNDASKAYEEVYDSKPELVIPMSVKTIRPQAFCGGAFSEIYLGQVENIEWNAFGEIDFNGHLMIPDTVKLIDREAFEYSSISELTIGKGLVAIEESCFTCCENLKKVNLSNGLKVINDSAFSSCEALEHIKIPSTVTELDDDAFSNTKIVDVTLPKNLKNFGEDAFYVTGSTCRIHLYHSTYDRIKDQVDFEEEINDHKQYELIFID